MSDSWKNSNDVLPGRAIAYLVCPNCHHTYTEVLRSRPGPCPACNSTTNRAQYDALMAESARAPELDPDDQMAHFAAVAAINDFPAPVASVSKHTHVHGPPRMNMATSPSEVRKTIAKAYVAFVHQPNPPPFYVNRDEIHFGEIMRLATESESLALDAAIEQKDMGAAEKTILGVLERALPSCPKCGGFAYRMPVGLRCGRCGIIDEGKP